MITEKLHGEKLFAAIEAGDFRQVSQLLEQGIGLNMSSQNGWTPLMLAILHHSDETVRLLLEKGADPNLTTQSEENPCRSPLAVAVSNGRLEAVRLLIAYNANVDVSDHNGLTTIGLAQKLAARPSHKERMTSILSVLKEHQNGSLGHPVLLSGRLTP